ncbi:TrkH family potassium uptake protein [Cucumibacter marinus]|uniref:TrkH family potassium uptake protein n=1 Tax=Cucumibacter marinus TaxID=1121252 RepID=UPI00041D5F89|nr:TrkH family potassium uptake protein [Cucumibacter marinus]
MFRPILQTAAHASGWFCLAMAAAMAVPMSVDLIDGNSDWLVFLNAGLIVGTISGLTVLASRGRIAPFSLRLGFVLVNALWLTTSLVAALPIYLSSAEIGLVDALFEAVSGMTTTGSTVLTGLDRMPRGLLLWRSITQWMGGIGIIAMGLLLMPFLRVGGMQVFQMESSNRIDKPMPHFKALAQALVGLYVLFTLACAVGYAMAGMDVFDAVNHAMTTVSTGGFSTHDASMGGFGAPVLIVATVFMLAGALPFVALLRAVVSRDIRRALDPQMPVLFGLLVLLSAGAAAMALTAEHGQPGDMILAATFNIVSVVTTTGFASTDYTHWGTAAIGIFMLATFLGGCAGSTSGGIKTYRLILMFESASVALKELVYPNGVFVIRFGRSVVSDSALRSVTVFIAAFFGVLLVFTVALMATGLDLVTAFTGTLTALTNVGPGMGHVIGPAGNFSSLPDAAKLMLAAVMLLGRLEILTVMVLFSPVFWRH